MGNAIVAELYDGAKTQTYVAGSVMGLFEQIEIYGEKAPEKNAMAEFIARLPRASKLEDCRF